MATGFRKGTTDFDDIFDPYVEGTKPANTGYVVSGYGDLANRYAPLSYGTKAANVGYSKPGVGDLSNLWAAKGTASYGLPINGASYTDSVGRGTASIQFLMTNSGTYQIINHRGTVLASGYWLPSGASVSSYSCKFTTTLFNGPDPGGGYDTVINTATTPQALTSSQYLTGEAGASVTGTTAYNSGDVVMYLYKSSVLQYTTTIHVEVSASG